MIMPTETPKLMSSKQVNLMPNQTNPMTPQKDLITDILACVTTNESVNKQLSELTGIRYIHGTFYTTEAQSAENFDELSENSRTIYLLKALSSPKGKELIPLLMSNLSPHLLYANYNLFFFFSRCIDLGLNFKESYKKLNKRYNKFCN